MAHTIVPALVVAGMPSLFTVHACRVCASCTTALHPCMFALHAACRTEHPMGSQSSSDVLFQAQPHSPAELDCVPTQVMCPPTQVLPQQEPHTPPTQLQSEHRPGPSQHGLRPDHQHKPLTQPGAENQVAAEGSASGSDPGPVRQLFSSHSSGDDDGSHAQESTAWGLPPWQAAWPALPVRSMDGALGAVPPLQLTEEQLAVVDAIEGGQNVAVFAPGGTVGCAWPRG